MEKQKSKSQEIQVVSEAKSVADQEPLTLAQIQKALAKVEKQRANTKLSEEERLVFEEAGLELRDAERSAIQDLQKQVIKDFQEETKQVSLQAKKIRETVKKLNKLDKALDATESVIKETVKVLKAIASLAVCLTLLTVLSLQSCVTMSKAQLTKINSLAVTSDSVSIAPSALFQKLSDVRQERGLMYVASLEGADNRIEELNALSKGRQSDAALIKKTDVYVSVLNSYIKALKSLSATTRYTQYGTVLRGIGRNVDSVLIAYNKVQDQLEKSGNIEEANKIDKEDIGISKQIGKTSGYLAEQAGRRVQRRLVKNVLTEGDTLVSTCCDALIELLKKEQVAELIKNEEAGLEANYRSYLNMAKVQGITPDTDFDRVYLQQKQTLADARELQTKCVSALRSLKNAHHKLLLQMKKPKKFDEYSEEFFELATQSAAVLELLN